MMRFFFLIVLLPALSTSFSLAAQEPPSMPTAATEASALPSATLQPALDSLQQTLITLRPEKWKCAPAVSQEAQKNIGSIQTDLETTLPPLLAVADQHPGSVAQVLPAYRNLSALYDVLLRVAQVARIAAPSQQSDALQQTVESLEASRRTLGDGLQSSALTENQQLHDLQAQLHTLQSTPAPNPVVCPAPVPPALAKKRKPRPKPAPATAPQTNAPDPR